jgi:hypothetical protein
MSDALARAVDGEDLKDRNRRLVRVLLGIMAALVVSAFLVGIRW